MGICYTAILLDEHNWGYSSDGDSLPEVLSRINACQVFDEAYSKNYGMIIFECDKMPPQCVVDNLRDMKIPYDAIYFIADNNRLNIFQI
jgi:hypothetical protein